MWCHVLDDAVAVGDTAAEPDRWNAYFVAGLAMWLVIVAADWLSDDTILIPLLIVVPLLTAVGGSVRQTAIVGSVAVVTAVALGWVDDIAGSRRHWVGIAATALASGLGVWLAARRTAHERQIASAVPVVRQADRLRASLATGRIGEWSWNLRSAEVIWDSNLCALYGLDDGGFAGTFEGWVELIDETDRDRVRTTVADAVRDAASFRFDHRCIWPDGSIHWVEGIGEVITEHGEVVGAFGLAMDVDDRIRQIDERNRLVESERRQRQRAEFIANMHDVLALSVDTEEILGRITTAVVPDVADWCSIVVSMDRPPERPLIRVAHSDPSKVQWAEQVQRDHPYDSNASWGAANVIRTRRREFIEHVDERVFDLPGGEILREAGVGAVITVPLIGTLGTLGAMQLIRDSTLNPFSADDLEFIDELAVRVGSALNTAVLFERQARGRAALDTLQQVSGRIASIATRDEVLRTALIHGASGIGAVAGAMFIVDADDELVRKETVGIDETHSASIELATARQAITAGKLVTTPVGETGSGTVIGVPLQIMNRTTGAIVLVAPDDRLVTAEELSMLVTLGSRCAGALERASLYERDRNVALTLQNRLLSVLPTTPAWLEAAARYVPATNIEIGGDWFQVLDAGQGRIAAIVGDAVGHGVASAAAMGQLRASIMTAVANDPTPGRTLTAADLFARRGADTFGATVGCVLLGPTERTSYACAGLPPPVWLRASGDAEILTGGRRPLLGIGEAGVDYEDATIDFAVGDTLVMYTDGLIERRGEAIDIGIERLRLAVAASSGKGPEDLCDAVLSEVALEQPEDDIAVLVMRRRPT